MIKTILLAGIFSGFVEPPRTAAPWCYWLWENSHVDAETIAAEAADIAQTGFGGVLMSDSRGYWDDDDHIAKPAPKMVWGSDEWLDTVASAVRACAANGIKFSMNIAASGGHLKGEAKVGADNPKFLKCRSYLPGDPFESPDIPNYREVAVFAVRTAETAERSGWENAGDGYYSMEGNVGKREGACDFKIRRALEVRELASAAEGAALGAGWTILRFGSGTIPGQEVDIDVLDRAAVRRHLDRTVGEVIARVPDLVGADKTFTHVYNVSWEGSMPTWSATFEADFAAIEGYPLRPNLPILAGFARDERPTESFMRDYRHARGVMMCGHLYGAVRAWAHERGIGAYSESGGPWGDKRNPKTFGECDQLLFLSNNDIPQGEFWPDGLRGVSRTSGHANRNGRYLTKGIVSAAHAYGLPIASAESFTHMERHWSVDPAYLKPIGDQALADGINRLVWHTYTCSPKSFGVPGLEFFAGSHINRNVTWHKDLPAFVRYLARCQYLLQRGEPVVDVAVLTGDRAYAGWGKAANGRLRNLVSAEMPVKVPKGFSYDAVNDDALARNHDLPSRYRVVFDARKPGNGDKTVPVDGLLPDVETDSDWTWNHRRDGRNDFYFVVGEGAAELTFRCQADAVEVWDAVTGTSAPAVCRRLADGRTRVNLTLPQGGSAFVMFLAADERSAADASVARTEKRVSVSGPWQVSFAYHEGISAPPPASVVLTNLVDFTTREDLRHFAGTAIYKTAFKVSGARQSLKLALGHVPSGLAHVYVNGTDCGTVWCAPWTADVSAAVRDGANELEIRYVNNWYNRLVGDCALPEDRRVTRSALHYWPGPRTWSKPENHWSYRPTLYSGYSADDPLQPSGLLGPIELMAL